MDLISDFVSEIYDVRYSLSKFSIALTKSKSDEDKINALRSKAETALETLAKDKVKVKINPSENIIAFDELSDTEKKRIIKRIILDNVNENIRSYLTLATRFSKETAYKDFIVWLISQNSF